MVYKGPNEPICYNYPYRRADYPVSVAACERLTYDADLGGSLPAASHVVVNLNLRRLTAVSRAFNRFQVVSHHNVIEIA